MPVVVPQNVEDALELVQGDKDQLDADKAAQASAVVALAAAQTAKDNADTTVANSTAKLNTDLDALIALEQSTYRPQ